MVSHLVVGLAKLNAITTSRSLATPLLISLVWPFLLKFSFSLRPVRQACLDMGYAARLFLFQMGQITFNADEAAVGGGGGGGGGGGDDGTRWERALRLVVQRITHARHSQSSQSDEDSLRAFSMLAL